MSADDLVSGFHAHYRRHPEHSDCVRIGAIERVLHGQGAINPEYYSAREHARKCEAVNTEKGKA